MNLAMYNRMQFILQGKRNTFKNIIPENVCPQATVHRDFSPSVGITFYFMNLSLK